MHFNLASDSSGKSVLCALVVMKEKGGKAPPPLKRNYILHIRSGGQFDVYRL